MNPKFEELRKRFIPSNLDATPHHTIFSNSPQVSEVSEEAQQPPPADSTEPKKPLAATKDRDTEIAVDEAKSVSPFGQAIYQLFEPAEKSREGLAEVATAFDSFLAGSALFESLADFRNHVSKLSNSFASMRAFQNDLGVLAESFEPVRELHQQVVQLADAIRIRLAQAASSLEPANALRVRAAELARFLECATELQGQFRELSQAFGPADQSNGTGFKGDRGEVA